MKKSWTIKAKIIGNDPDLPKYIRVLNRILRWHDGIGVAYEPDPRHTELITKELGVESLSSLRVPGVRQTEESNNEKSIDSETR